jgi:hypothetical protein
VALEVKDEKWKPPKPGTKAYARHVPQQQFIDDVNEAGGIAGFVRTVDDAMELLGLV